ncbi:hypothetical protein CON53_27585 [Bacillus cereus]|nr:hypothetical protein CON53_27585 [Bacillus cereus]PFH88500.1 hypothetical protein COI81_13335 [Bacillus cereus]PFM50339.1 hypothetical protein COJ52_27080 [Bacillus cereus]PGS20677.1 hypothetical protein COC55_27140 [Bacillus cereus]
MKKNEKSYYINEYTLRDRTTKSIKIETWRSLKDEMIALGIKDSDIFQIQMIKIDSKKSNIASCHATLFILNKTVKDWTKLQVQSLLPSSYLLQSNFQF